MEARLTSIDRGQVLRYLGYKGGELPSELDASLRRCEALLLETARPRVLWKLFPLLPDGSLGGTCFRPAGKDVRTFLGDCTELILLAATLGNEVERLIRKAQVSDMTEAMILDACGSAAIEAVCDALCEDLAAAFAPRYLTDRYSPGYGDFPLTQQAELFSVLDVTRRIGVTLSPGGLMLPQKSVTALVGVSDRPQPMRPRGCAACPISDRCTFRKEGKTCGSK